MPRPLHDHDEDVVLEAERDIRSRLGDRALDFEAMLAVSNIYRAANAVRNRMEREVLGPAGLSWGGFTILFVLWVWGERETGQLADDCGLAKGTLSGMLSTLEKSGLVERSRHSDDGRRVVVRLLDGGLDTIELGFPRVQPLRGQVHRRPRPRRETGTRHAPAPGHGDRRWGSSHRRVRPWPGTIR